MNYRIKDDSYWLEILPIGINLIEVDKITINRTENSDITTIFGKRLINKKNDYLNHFLFEFQCFLIVVIV